MKLIALLLIALSLHSIAQPPTTINLATMPTNAFFHDIKEPIITAYRQLNYQIVFHDVPLGRSLAMTNNGQFDGELIRTEAIEALAPNLIRVEPKLLTVHLVLMCKLQLKCDEQVLDDESNVIGILNGENITSLYMRDRKAHIYKSTHLQYLGNMFKHQRFDYLLSANADDKNFMGINTKEYQVVTLQSFNAYHYLHKKHRDLAEDLSKALTVILAEQGAIKITSQ